MRRGYVETALGLVHYRRSGHGPPLLLLAAAGRSSRMFAGLMPRLAGFDAIALDTPGFGASDDLARGTSIEDLADAFTQVTDVLGLTEVALYGLHTGNKIGAAMAVRHPGRIRRLVLAGQSHSLISDQDTRNAGIRDIIASYVDMADSARPDAGKTGKISRLLKLAQDGMHPEIGGDILDHVIDEAEARGTAALYLANFAYDLGRDFRAIRVPTLVLEIATPFETARVGLQGPEVAAMIPDATLATFAVPDRDEPLTLEDEADELARVIGDFCI